MRDQRQRNLALAGTVLATLWGALAVAPAVAEAPPPITIRGSLESGAYLGTDDSYEFGDFTGLKDDGWSGLANVELNGRAPWDSGDIWYFHLFGANLALESRSIEARGGLQGLVDFYFEWDQIPRFEDDTAQFAMLGRGTQTITLPPGWVPADTTAGFTALDENLSRLNLSRDRRTLRTGFDLILPRGFEFATDYEYERRQGRWVTGAIFGNTGGNPRSMLIPEKRNWQTHEVDSRIRYADEVKQFEIGYENSFFDNRNDFLTFQNAFTGVGGWNPAAFSPDGFGRKGGPPDNTFHQIFGSGGYSLPFWRTRISGQASFAWFRQNDDFLSFTVNPALLVPVGLPRGDLNGEINATNVNFRISSRPLDRLRVDAHYRFDNRDNDTERDTFIGVPGDSLDQDTVDSARARRNLPNSFRLHEGKVDLGFKLFDRTELSTGYTRRYEERSFTEVDRIEEDQIRAGFRSRALRWADFRVDGLYSDRRIEDDYNVLAPLIDGFSPEHVLSVSPLSATEDFENHPALRKFNLTDRERYGADARLTVMPLDTASLGFHVGWKQDDFSASELGLRERETLSWGVDGSWAPLENVTTYAWYTHERLESDVRGRQFNNAVQAFDGTRNWEQQEVTDIDTVGVGAEWFGLEERLKLRADYAFSWAKERIDISVGSGLATPQPFPDNRFFFHDVSFTAEYEFLDGFTGRFGYLFEFLDQNDFSYEDTTPTTLTQVLGLGQSTPDFAAHLFSFSIKYEFGF
ncbi:MtrB/PioB family decaheme-associated outer membrane protein [Myxococcota bacterium]|nr:MtrB/PioB family decaheme-associated outer membrane protein [Myxococcota bacterium]MCZ7619872.1 MtrB/PioB family decaheme-associated outer membrane protein [Myxococcota bacterium]